MGAVVAVILVVVGDSVDFGVPVTMVDGVSVVITAIDTFFGTGATVVAIVIVDTVELRDEVVVGAAVVDFSVVVTVVID